MNIDPKDEWFQQRWGKFTASEINKLLAKGTGDKMFGVGAMTYIKQKAIEAMTVMWERPYLEFLKPLLHGKAHEWPAFEMYREITRNKSMRYFGTEEPVFLSYNQDSGGSPDGLLGEREIINLVLEMKCPANSSVHFDYLNLKDQWEFKEYAKDYYAQIQFLLMITKATDGAHFVSFDDRFKDRKKKTKIIEIKHDKKFQENLDLRIDCAVLERNRIILEAA